MPPRVSFGNDRILDCAFAIVRKDGLGGLSARRIANELECSTRPVYGAFTSMAALQGAVVHKAKEFALQFFLKGEKETESLFLDMGLRYYRFSQEEPELFKMLYMEGRMGGSFENPGQHFAPLLARMKDDPRLAGLSQERLKRLGVNTWVYTHGLIALVHAFQPHDTEQIVRARLSEMGRILLEWEQGHRKET
jgi:AcrR family transcriptional regulator